MNSVGRANAARDKQRKIRCLVTPGGEAIYENGERRCVESREAWQVGGGGAANQFFAMKIEGPEVTSMPATAVQCSTTRWQSRVLRGARLNPTTTVGGSEILSNPMKR